MNARCAEFLRVAPAAQILNSLLYWAGLVLKRSASNVSLLFVSKSILRYYFISINSYNFF